MPDAVLLIVASLVPLLAITLALAAGRARPNEAVGPEIGAENTLGTTPPNAQRADRHDERAV
jgi:hypothetical protein